MQHTIITNYRYRRICDNPHEYLDNQKQVFKKAVIAYACYLYDFKITHFTATLYTISFKYVTPLELNGYIREILNEHLK